MPARPPPAPARLSPRSPGVFAAVLLAHAAVLGLLLTQTRAPQPAPKSPPLFVRLIEPAAPPQAPPVASTPSPSPRPVPPRQPPPVLAATPSQPQPSAPAVAAPAPRPPEPAAESPRADAAPAPATAPAEAPRPAPPLVQPRFNADYLDNPKPAYPSLSRRMGEEGEVRLRVLVDAAGNAQQVEIERSSGFPRLDQAALDTVKRWRFVPARQGDQPVAAWVIVPIQFTLRS
ncbi:MAG: energy transducer TonB [Thiobacillus sp.]